MTRHAFRRVALPFLQASLVKQILIGLILGIALAYIAPEVAKTCAFFGARIFCPKTVFPSRPENSPTAYFLYARMPFSVRCALPAP